MDNFADRLGARIFECNNPTVMGLDPLTEYLPQEIRRKHGLATADDPGSIIYSDVKNQKDEYMARAANAILEFNMLLIDAVSGIIPAVKPQIAYYEILGHAGIKAYTETITYAKKHDMLVIADAKRNDIGSKLIPKHPSSSFADDLGSSPSLAQSPFVRAFLQKMYRFQRPRMHALPLWRLISA